MQFIQFRGNDGNDIIMNLKYVIYAQRQRPQIGKDHKGLAVSSIQSQLVLVIHQSAQGMSGLVVHKDDEASVLKSLLMYVKGL